MTSPPAPRAFYLSDVFPGPRLGGAVIVQRHLQRLAREGWRVTVAAPAQALLPLPATPGLEIRPLPSRRFWWPPARPEWPASQRLRARLWAGSVRRDPSWALPPPATVLTVLWGEASLAAARIARAWGAPLAVIVHDLFSERPLPRRQARAGERLTREVLGGADRVWAVSPEMAEVLAPLCRPGAVRALAPVPEQGAAPAGGWTPRFRAGPVVAHAGALHAHQVDYLAAVARAAAAAGGSLLVITPPDNPALAALAAAGAPFRHQAPFATSAEVLRFLAAEASAITVMYPFDPAAYRHPPTGFPSRLVEFANLGLPILIAAPPGNPASNWARRHGWPLLLERFDPAELAAAVAGLADETRWRSLAARMRATAAAACDPETIQRQFLAELPRRAAA